MTQRPLRKGELEAKVGTADKGHSLDSQKEELFRPFLRERERERWREGEREPLPVDCFQQRDRRMGLRMPTNSSKLHSSTLSLLYGRYREMDRESRQAFMGLEV